MMITGVGKQLKIIRTVLSNNINDIYICQNINDQFDNNCYTLIKIHKVEVVKNVLSIIYDKEGKCKLPKDMFCGLFIDVDTLNILMKYYESRKLFSYLKSYMNTEYSEHIIIKNLLYQCLLLDVDPAILYLFLNPDNINLNQDLSICFNGFLDFSRFNKDIDEEKCVKVCCDLIYQICLSNESLTNNSQVKSINLFIKKRRNNVYKRMIELYNDFKIKEKKYRQRQDNYINYVNYKIINIIEKVNLKKIIVILGSCIIILAVVIFLCNLFKLDIPFTKYKGFNIIGTVNMAD